MGGLRHSFMRLCFKRFLTAVPRYRWLDEYNAAEFIQRLLLRPESDRDIQRLSNLAGIAVSAHHLCRYGDYCDERHPIVLACRHWHTRH
eukprot:5254588-Amphidinium_carterae.1